MSKKKQKVQRKKKEDRGIYVAGNRIKPKIVEKRNKLLCARTKKIIDPKEKYVLLSTLKDGKVVEAHYFTMEGWQEWFYSRVEKKVNEIVYPFLKNLVDDIHMTIMSHNPPYPSKISVAGYSDKDEKKQKRRKKEKEKKVSKKRGKPKAKKSSKRVR